MIWDHNTEKLFQHRQERNEVGNFLLTKVSKKDFLIKHCIIHQLVAVVFESSRKSAILVHGKNSLNSKRSRRSLHLMFRQILPKYSTDLWVWIMSFSSDRSITVNVPDYYCQINLQCRCSSRGSVQASTLFLFDINGVFYTVPSMLVFSKWAPSCAGLFQIFFYVTNNHFGLEWWKFCIIQCLRNSGVCFFPETFFYSRPLSPRFNSCVPTATKKFSLTFQVTK